MGHGPCCCKESDKPVVTEHTCKRCIFVEIYCKELAHGNLPHDLEDGLQAGVLGEMWV